MRGRLRLPWSCHVNARFRRAAGSDLVRNGAIVFSAAALGNVFNYVYYLLMGRALTVRDYGSVMSLVSAILLVIGIGTIGQTTVAKLAADLRAAEDEYRMAAFARAISRLSLAIALMVFTAVFVLRNFFASYLHFDRPDLVVLAGAAAAVGFVLLLQRGLFQGFGMFGTYGMSAALDGTKAIFLFPLAHAFGALGAVVAFFAAIITSTVCGGYFMYRRFVGIAGATRLDFRRLMLTAGATGISSLSIVVLTFYDVVLAKHFLGPLGAGFYGAASLAGRVLLGVISFLPIILLPDIALRSASGRSHKHVLGAALLVAGGIIAVMAVACWWAPRLVLGALAGHAFLAAAPLLLPYMLASGALALGNVLAMYAIARHRFGFVPYILLVAACEITAVVVRHGSAMEIVQDILGGHGAIFLVMTAWLIVDFTRPSAISASSPAAMAK